MILILNYYIMEEFNTFIYQVKGMLPEIVGFLFLVGVVVVIIRKSFKI